MKEREKTNFIGKTNKEDVLRSLSISLRTLPVWLMFCGYVRVSCTAFTVECVFHFLHFTFSWFRFLSMLLFYHVLRCLFFYTQPVQRAVTMPKKVIAIWKSLIILFHDKHLTMNEIYQVFLLSILSFSVSRAWKESEQLILFVVSCFKNHFAEANEYQF